MPVVVVAGTIVRFSMQGDINGRACDNVVDVSLDEFGTDRNTAVRDTVDRIVEAWQDNTLNALGSWYRFHGARYIDLDSPSGITGFRAPISGHPTLGQAGGSQHPPNTSALIHKQSDARRNSRNGRMYLAPILETDTDDGGVMSSTAITRFQNAMNGLKSDITGAGTLLGFTVAWRVVHITGHDSDGNPNAWDSSDVSSTSVDQLAATQRRRLRA